jgi:hypothetical protein
MISAAKRYSRYRVVAALLLLLAAMAAHAASGERIVVDFEDAVVFDADDMPERVEQWVEKDVVFRLAHEPRQSKAKGLVMFFLHLSSGHKGIGCAMATEPIPVRATFPTPVSSVTLALWGSTDMPALLEAFDPEGNVVDRAKLKTIPGRKVPGEPIPIFEMTVSADCIAYIEFSGPREGEFLAADEVRFTPVEDNDQK